MAKKLMVVDGNSLMHRAFYALPLLTNKNGEYTNAVYGFFSMLINAIDSLKPDFLAIAFDKKGKTFRHRMYTEYKAKRKQTPEELIPQFSALKNTLKQIGIASLELEGYEADDLLGVLAKIATNSDVNSILLTGDKDAFQLVSDTCRVMLTRKGVSELEIYDKKKLYETYELVPEQIVDLKGFMGDSSDNIPGVRGVGEKTALKLLHAYKDMEGVYENIDELKGKLKEKIQDSKDIAYLSRKLARIDVDAPMDVPIENLVFSGFKKIDTVPVFEKLGFSTLLKRMGFKEEKKNVVEQVSIENMTALRGFLSRVNEKEYLAITFGDNITLACAKDKEYIIKNERSLLNLDFSGEMIIKELKPFLEDKNIGKLLHGAKKIISELKGYGVFINGILFDTKLAEYSLNPGRSKFELSALGEEYGVSGQAGLIAYLYDIQKEELKKNNLWYIYNDIEVPLRNVLLNMESTGFRVSLQELKSYSEKLSAQISLLTKTIYELCKYDDFNINSTKQLGDVLFKRLALPSVKMTKTGYSTDIEVLEKLVHRHPVINKIIEYRRLTKLKSTYIDGLERIADKNGFIHTTFMQISTVTGRISSKEPNLQNIPIKTKEGKEIRRLFLPSLDDKKLIAADYSQIELRILAAVSNDTVMKNAFFAGDDIHTRTASEVFGVPFEEVTEEMRRNAKAVNFGIVYGISDFGLAKNLKIPMYKAADFIKRYFMRFAGVKEYMDDIKIQAKQAGYVTTLLGRRRYLPELHSKNFNIRSFGERAALNTPIQGTAADIIKIAMINVVKELERGGFSSKLILQVHDELIIDTEQSEVDSVSRLLKNCMENAYKLDVPLIAEVSVGDNWLDAK